MYSNKWRAKRSEYENSQILQWPPRCDVIWLSNLITIPDWLNKNSISLNSEIMCSYMRVFTLASTRDKPEKVCVGGYSFQASYHWRGSIISVLSHHWRGSWISVLSDHWRAFRVFAASDHFRVCRISTALDHLKGCKFRWHQITERGSRISVLSDHWRAFRVSATSDHFRAGSAEFLQHWII